MDAPFYSTTTDGQRLLNLMAEEERLLDDISRELDARRYFEAEFFPPAKALRGVHTDG